MALFKKKDRYFFMTMAVVVFTVLAYCYILINYPL